MSSIKVSSDQVTIELTTTEKAMALRGDIVVPRNEVVSVELVTHALGAVSGIRAPGLNLPGVRKVGTWRSQKEREFVAVKPDQPAVRIELGPDSDFTSLLIGCDDAAQIVSSLQTGP